MRRSYRHILGMRVDSGTYSSSTELVREWALNKEARFVCVSNVHMTMETVDSPEFRNVVNTADLVTSDGMPLVWMLRKLGLTQSERVYGPELVLHICAMAEREQISIGLYGGTSRSLEQFTSFLAKNYPDLTVSYQYAPPFRPLSKEEDASVVHALHESGARILFVGIGCPKQERWMYEHRASVQAVQIGVGAAFDFHSGSVRQAPNWMGKSGLEWLFRLAMEPRRLWKRYAVHNPRFMVRAAGQLLRQRMRPSLLSSFLPLVLLLGMLVGNPLSGRVNRAVFVDQNHPNATDYGNGTESQPFLTISAALESDLLISGDTLLIGAGLYRESILPQSGGRGPSSRLVISAKKNEEVVITGADAIGKASRESDALWVIENYSPLDFYGSGTTYEREMVIADGRVLTPVFEFENLVEGTFFVDRISASRGRILMNTGASDAPSVELGRRGLLFFPGPRYSRCGEAGNPDWFHLKDLTFRYAANQAQTGAVCIGGEGTLVENVTVEWTNGVGMQVRGANHRLRNVTSNHNGQAGINGSCSGCLIDESETSFNNWVGHDPFWEAGGGKWSESRNIRFMNHRSIGNEGPGLWLDGDNRDVAVIYSTFENNLAAGIFIELNSSDVMVERTSISSTRRLHWTGSGILVQAAGSATLRENRLQENDGAGIWLRGDDRAQGGFNRIERNVFDNNARVPGQDRADLQIGAESLVDLCSNLISENELGESGGFYFEIEGFEAAEGNDLDQFQCLANYSRR